MTKTVNKKTSKGKQKDVPVINSDSNNELGTRKLFLRLKIPPVTPASSLEDQVSQDGVPGKKLYLRLPASSFKPKRNRR
ncbi:unnamed protein product, partial [Mucor hiemalis]